MTKEEDKEKKEFREKVREEKEHHSSDAELDKTLKDTFPASDPPADY